MVRFEAPRRDCPAGDPPSLGRDNSRLAGAAKPEIAGGLAGAESTCCNRNHREIAG